MTKHAILSASSSYRWLKCQPSARLEQQFDHEPGQAAKEGTAAHALCEHKLKKALKMRSKRPVSEFDTDEMEECTDAYVDFILEQLEIVKQTCPDPIVLIEQHLDMTRWVPEGFGTGDCLIVADHRLHIIDFKYGTGVLVEAENNSQMMLYALGALNLFDALYDINEVSMTIFQPRRENISTWTIDVDQLMLWATKDLMPKAKKAFDGEGAYCPGQWCQFCRASNRCRARARENLKIAQKDFALPPLLSDTEIEEILQQIPELTRWANSIQEYASDAAINHGKHWEGFKVVLGRSIRKFKDEDKVKERCGQYGYKDIYRMSLITITEMEKLMGKKKFKEIMSDLVYKPPGKPVLVPESDKRPAVDTSNAESDFKEE